MIKGNEQAEAINSGRDWGGDTKWLLIVQRWAASIFLPLTELSVLGYVEHLFLLQIRYLLARLRQNKRFQYFSTNTSWTNLEVYATQIDVF